MGLHSHVVWLVKHLFCVFMNNICTALVGRQTRCVPVTLGLTIPGGVGLNPAGEKIFFENQYFLHTLFLKFSLDNTVQARIETRLEQN